jgi:hypothetical protein
MRITTLVTLFLLILAGCFSLGAGPANAEEVEEICYFYDENIEPIPVEYDCSEIRVTGHSQGNHELDCTVIQPWSKDADPDPRYVPYPVIGWANGWDTGNVIGEYTTFGYKLGLIEWALDGPYIVVAANQWSVQESDVLACVQWVINDYEHAGSVDGSKIGLAGHSQGGGAVIKAGDGWTSEPYEITTVIAMNPYGPGWVNPENQDGPVLLLGGDDDTTTPPDSYDAVWEAIEAAYNPEDLRFGGVNAVLEDGTHNSEAWGVKYVDGEEETLDWVEAQEVNFGRYQHVTELWWDFHLNDNARSIHRLMQVLSRDPWDQEDCCETQSTDNF